MSFDRLLICLSVALLSSCAATQEVGDIPLDWESRSARLMVFEPNGDRSVPFGGEYFSVPGYVFTEGSIALHPGKTRIHYGCPLSATSIHVTHYVPSIEFTFEAGKAYELRCIGEDPVITVRK